MTEEQRLLRQALTAMTTATQLPDLLPAAAAIALYFQRLPKNDDRSVSPCCNAPFMSQRSYNKKVCYDCGLEYPWVLKPGQQPLIKAQR